MSSYSDVALRIHYQNFNILITSLKQLETTIKEAFSFNRPSIKIVGNELTIFWESVKYYDMDSSSWAFAVEKWFKSLVDLIDPDEMSCPVLGAQKIIIGEEDYEINDSYGDMANYMFIHRSIEL